MIDHILFDDLLKADPAEVCSRTHADFDSETGVYTLEFWGKAVAVDPGGKKVGLVEGEFSQAWTYAPLVAVHFLLSAKKRAVSGQWVSEKDITGGSAFFRGPHTLPAHDIAARFKRDLVGFSNRCRENHGQPLEMADAAFAFEPLQSIPVAVLLWLGDEEFPAEARLLFDRTIEAHLPLDIIYALAVMVCKTLS